MAVKKGTKTPQPKKPAVAELADIKTLKENPDNPRTITQTMYEKLVQSIKTFPEMLMFRPLVVDKDLIVIGGNMRLKACRDAGMKQVPIIKAESLTEKQKREFVIKDNLPYGEFDWDVLANKWEVPELNLWGLNVPMDMSGLERPAFKDDEDEKFGKPDEKYFYAEFYSDEENYGKVKEALGDLLEGANKINTEFFADAILEAVKKRDKGA